MALPSAEQITNLYLYGTPNRGLRWVPEAGTVASVHLDAKWAKGFREQE
jgi:hypothetical protein